MPNRFNPKNINTVVFDMDGLILDTEAIAEFTFVEACGENGLTPNMSIFYKCIGVNWEATQRIISEGYGGTFPLGTFFEVWKAKMHTEMTEKPIPLKTGALSLLNYLETQRYNMALVTSTRTDAAQRELSNAGLARFFELILGGDQVLKSKPDPEIYLTACSKLRQKPGNCLALEDSNYGVLAAFHAGLRVIQVPDLVPPSSELKALGHTIMASLAEVEDMFRKSNGTV